jgi:hypothetical protein
MYYSSSKTVVHKPLRATLNVCEGQKEKKYLMLSLLLCDMERRSTQGICSNCEDEM